MPATPGTWIDTRTELPQPGVFVLLALYDNVACVSPAGEPYVTESRRLAIGQMDFDGSWYELIGDEPENAGGPPIAWMPLPMFPESILDRA